MIIISNFTIKAKTPSSVIAISTSLLISDVATLAKYEDYNKFANLCKTGCPNYEKKWSCPPFSPPFSSLYSKYENVLLLLMFANLDQYSYISSDYLKVKAANSTLKSISESILRGLENKLEGTSLLNGSCRLCKPCNCKIELPCKKPLNRRFSMEAVGLNVDQISQDYFSHKLKWYKSKHPPKYTSVISCVLTNQELDTRGIIISLKEKFYILP